MTELESKIARRIEAEGPIAFSAFMQMALYDEQHGYYRRDPFGKAGDFYTASQLQPVFGAYAATLAAQIVPGYEQFIDIGAGRGEMSEAFPPEVYRSVEVDVEMPKTKRGVLFSNELIDAMPVDLVVDDTLLRVTHREGVFAWHPHGPREGVIEVRPEVARHLKQAYEAIEEGSYILIDYGYRSRERARFINGSLMSYRKHAASEEVLREPGQRDITAHVDWDALLESASEAGWVLRSFERLRSSILGLGPDVLEGLNLLGEMKLKTLLFGLGESFDVVVLDKK